LIFVAFFAAAAALTLRLVSPDDAVRSLASRLRGEESPDPALSALRVTEAAKEALSALGIADEQLSAESGAGGEPGSATAFWEAPLPPGVTLEEANLAVTEAVTAAGGRIADGFERPARGKVARALTLVAAADSIECLEVRLYEVPAAVHGKGPGEAKLAVVVGALGEELDETVKRFIDSPLAMSFAVLPGRDASRETARYAASKGKEVLLHLPMEPVGFPARDPGRGAVLLDQSAGKIRKTVLRDIDEIGVAAGAVSYMGSAATRDRDVMRAVLGALKEAGLFFVDSSASVHSVVAETAREIDLPCVRNDLFLGGSSKKRGLLAKRLDRAERLALDSGSALVIARADAELLELLASRAEGYQSRGLKLVAASELAGYGGR